MAKLIWGSDLYKGFKLDRKQLMGGQIDDILPFQMLTLEEKTEDWVKAVADYYEVAGWANVEKKAQRIQKNYWLRYGKLDQSDYIINPENQFSDAIGMITPKESQSPLEQFYPLVPNFVDVLRGEFIKRDNTWTIEAIDTHSVQEAFDYKKSQFEEILSSQLMLKKQQTLQQLGISPESDEKAYQFEMEKAMVQLREVELKSKTFRSTGVQWAEKVLKIQDKRYNLAELEADAFESGLITDSEFWHIDMMEDDFRVEMLNPKWCDYHKGPNVKYVSQGDYFLWFDFMSAGDIVNKLGRKMKEEDILKLKDIYVKTSNIIVPDYLKARQGEYYDLSKPWSQATDLNPTMNDAMLGKELAYSYMRSPNFDHNIEVDIFNPIWGKNITGHPQMFKVMRLYWRSMKRIGWLTKVNKDGSIDEPTWVDENYKCTVKPVYDKSIVKEETKDNLIYGEHIDWTWVNDWRQVIKISLNKGHAFWGNESNTFDSIYIDGGPVPFQFKGRNNQFDSLPPVEGCVFSHINSGAHGFVDRIKPFQILYNISMNKVPKKILKDYGNKVAMDRRMMKNNHMSNSTNHVDPVEAYDEKLRESDIFDYTITRESMEGGGTPGLPTVLQLSTVQEAQWYMQLSQAIKMEAGEVIGITRQRLGQNKASETASGINQSILYSETQTEKYYEQHSNLMQRVRQRMLDAAQYFSTFKETTREVYMNEMDENVFLEIEGMNNLLPHYNINLQSKANVRSALQTITNFLVNENTLPIAPSAKLTALVENSIPKILSLVRKSELEQIQNELDQQKMQQEAENQRMEYQQQIQAQNLQNENEQKQLDRESDENIAMIRALGGLQSDSNADGTLDATANMNAYLKEQELQSNARLKQKENDLKKSIDTNKLMLEREKALLDIEKEKIKQKGNLAVAKENKNN
jgi:hypothetical protein